MSTESPNRKPQRRVVCAAVKAGNHIVLGARHFDTVMHAQLALLPGNISVLAPSGCQGFIDQWGKFMNRDEAFLVAKSARQIRKKSGNPNSTQLFSEDLY